jgi:hypothetical protein
VPTILMRDNNPLCRNIVGRKPRAAFSSSRSFSRNDREACFSIRSIACGGFIVPFKMIDLLTPSQSAIWALPEGDGDFSMRWSLIKSGFSRGLDSKPRSLSKVRKREKGIWQRRYWEHAIRDDADLERHVDYIHFNPVKHGHVTRVTDWPHSSFHRYVKHGLLAADWGGDVQDIKGSFGE